MNNKQFDSYNTATAMDQVLQPSAAGDNDAAIQLYREPLTDATRLHTQAFTANAAINPLVAACAPLLNLATQLQGQTIAPCLKSLHAKLCHEMRVFADKARQQHYRSSVILAARYFLCAFLDEVISTASRSEHSHWQEQNLLQTFQHERWGGERFFVILERGWEDPKPHLDLLELGYLCLSLGYEGKYRYKPHSQHALNTLIDKLYYLIREQRGDFAKCLAITAPLLSATGTGHSYDQQQPGLVPYAVLPAQETSSTVSQSQSSTVTRAKTLRRPLPVWPATAMVIAGLVVSYLPYRIHLDKLIKPVQRTLVELQSSDKSIAQQQPV